MGIGKEGENLLFFEGCNFKTRKKHIRRLIYIGFQLLELKF